MLVRHIVGAGVTSLGKANYADKTGEYYTAFFGLSIGLERLSKLISVANYAICNHGKMPDDKYVRGYGHKLIKLLDVVDKISQKRGLKLDYMRPSSGISVAMIRFLDGVVSPDVV